MGGGAAAACVKKEILAHYLKKRKMDRLLRGSTSSVGNLLVDVVNEEESASTSERFGWQIFTEEEWRPSAESNKQLR